MTHNNEAIEALKNALSGQFETSSQKTTPVGDEEIVYCKFGVYNLGGKSEYYALPCILYEDGFENEEEMDYIRQKLQNGELEAHDLSMDELKGDLLYKYNPETERWSLNQEDHNITSRLDFSFVTEEEFSRLVISEKVNDQELNDTGLKNNEL